MVLEVALAFVLLVGSGLMIRSFIALQRAQPGYDPNGVLTFFIPNLPIPDDQGTAGVHARSAGQARGAAGRRRASRRLSPLPLELRESLARYGTEEALVDPTKFGQGTVYFVQPGVLRRDAHPGDRGAARFTEEDNRPEARDVVIDRVLAAASVSRAVGDRPTLVARVQRRSPSDSG